MAKNFFNGTTVKQMIEQGIFSSNGCTHTDEISDVTPSGEGCNKCLEMGDTWVNLRICMICGHVGCCDASKNKHATKHFHETGHRIIQSFMPNDDWLWCYEDEVGIKAP